MHTHTNKRHTHTRELSISHTRTQTHILSLSHKHTHILTHTHILAHTHTHQNSLSLTYKHTHTHTRTLYLSHTNTHIYTHSLFLTHLIWEWVYLESLLIKCEESFFLCFDFKATQTNQQQNPRKKCLKFWRKRKTIPFDWLGKTSDDVFECSQFSLQISYGYKKAPETII